MILGLAACVVFAEEGLPTLSSHGLPTPKWVESWGKVRGCFPGGCDVCGLWVCVEGGGEKDIISELVTKSDMLVGGGVSRGKCDQSRCCRRS